MSLLVHYTLTSAADHDRQAAAMAALIAGLRAEGVAAHYAAFATDDPTRFVGLLEYDDEAGKRSFLDSAAFAAYRETVGPTFANPPQTTEIRAIATTRA